MRELNENLFKGCIKRKISFTASTFVKFLITGTVAISLTACGGGGGGGGSSSSGGNGSSGDNNSGNDYVIVYPEIEQIKAEIDIENENKIFDENIVKKKVEFNYAGLKVSKNSEVAIQKEKNIDISGEKGITGVVVSDSSKVTNEGNIKVSSDYLSKDILRDASSENIIKYMSKGMLVTNKSTGINEGTIEIKGSTVGILAYGKGSTGINNGTIKLVGDKSKNNLEKIPTIGMASMKDGKVVNNRIIEIKNENSNLLNIGMYGEHNAEIINEKTGVIDITGKAIGMMIDGKNGAKNIATNKGNIKISTEYLPELSEEDDTYDTVNKYMPNISSGIFVIDKATGENNGTIEIEGSAAGVITTGKKSLGVNRGDIKVTSKEGSTFDELPSIGMISSNNGKVVNEGNIIGAVSGAMGMLTSEGELLNKGTIQFTEGNDNYGLAVKNGVAENSETGRITISSSEKKHSASEGITVEREGKAINKGKIEITNNSVSQDQYYDMAMHGWEGSELVNAETGIINISGITEGMVVNGIKGGENKAINNGIINIDTTKLYGTEGKATSGMVAKNGGEIENNKLITGKGQNIIGMNGFNNNNETINTIINNGDIELSGTEIKGIYGSGKVDITNNGIIHLNIAKETTNLYGTKTPYGTAGIWIENGEAVNEVNGKIVIDNKAENYADGVFINENGGKFTNKGLIEINGGYGAGIDTGYVPYIDGVNRPELQKEAIAINDKTGVIRVTGTSDFNEMYGMIADGPKASIINRGEINANGKNSFGMGTYGGATAENYGTIVMNGKLHIDKTNITSDTFKGMSAEGEKGQITNNGTIELKHTIDLINPYDDKGLEPNITKNAIGMEASNGAIAINNKDIIGQGEITGMSAENSSIAKNAGNIKLTSIHYDGKVEWDQDIITKKYPSYTVGLYGTGNETKVENIGVIDIIGDGAAIKAVDEAIGSNSGEINLSSQILEVEGNHETQYTFPKGLEARGTGTVENLEDGKININGHAVGIRVRDNGKGYNYGIINISSNNYARGMEVRENGYVENHGDIIFNSGEGMGIRVKNNGTAENFGRIYVKDNSYGIAILLDADDIVSNSASATNNGNITVIGTNSIGMQAFNSCTVTNGKDGIINVNGQGSYGMQATGVGAIANNYGIINVGDEASGGMVATEGGYIYNNGVINIDKAHSFDTQEDAENFAMQIDGTSTMKNEGTINTNADIKVEASGIYVIGTNRNGSYGRISARNMNLDGDVIVETDIVRGDYKKEHILENVVEAEDIKLGEDVKFESNSLLYNASAEKDVFGNLDAKLERNSNNISDFTDKKFVNVSSIFDDYINNEEEYNKLSSVEKDVVDTIFDYSTSENSLKSAINQVTGTEYLNIQRQIFDIKNSFRKFDSSLISTLDNHDFNFQFIGEYSDISSKNGISGYESKMTGFNGAAKLSENLYGVLGYGYSDIDYDGNSDGKIQTIHTGIYKDSIVQEYNLRTGVYGEYNFHENNRGIFDKNAESDFNSYLVGVSGEVNKKYGKELYIQPSLSLDIAYGNIENFNESKANGFNLKVDEENYTSILPKIKMDLGREFTNSKVFASIGYSYELGDMDKDMTIELLNKKADVKNNEMEHGQFDISVGGSLNINDLSLNAEVGKEFGRRDREYVRAGFSYRF